MPQGEVKIFVGSIHPHLGKAIAQELGVMPAKVKLGKFKNGETRVEIEESIRGADCYIVQPICNSEDGKMSVNDALMEVLVMVNACRLSSVRSICVVLPVFGYARQDKKEGTRASVTARLVSNFYEVAGIDHGIAVDLHAGQIQGFFQKPLDNIQAMELMCTPMMVLLNKSISHQNAPIIIVSPDAGGAKRATRVAEKIKCEVCIIDKTRKVANEVASMRLVGSVEGKIAVIADDMADTCGTLCLAAELLEKEGALEVHAYITHGIFSDNAIERINKCSALKSIIITNTLPQNRNQSLCSKITVLSIAKLLADSIQIVARDKSLQANLTARL